MMGCEIITLLDNFGAASGNAAATCLSSTQTRTLIEMRADVKRLPAANLEQGQKLNA